MDYIKELQGFADKLRSMDPGMYFSNVYQVDSVVWDCCRLQQY